MKKNLFLILKPVAQDFEIDWQEEDRISLLLVAVIYPLWTFVCVILNFENTDANPLSRVGVGVVAALILSLSYWSNWVRTHLTLLTTGCLCILITNFFWVLYANSLHDVYAIGGFIVVFGITGLVNIPKHLIFVGTYCLIASWFATSSSHDFKFRTFYLLGMWTTLLISYFSANRRLLYIYKVRRAQDTIEKQKIKMAAHSRLSALGEMAAGVAHQINTPLTTINLSTELCRDFLLDDPNKVKDILSGIEDKVEEIAKIIRGLKTFARDAGSDPMNLVSVDLILQEVCLLCESQLGYQNIRLVILNRETHLFIECRQVQIAQILMNLIHNSAHALRFSKDREIRIEIIDQKDDIEIKIQDNGPGIEASAQEKIFQPFFSTNDIGTNTGLGLSISRGVAEAHQGTLILEGKLGAHRVSANFILRLPKKQGVVSDKERVA